MTAPIGSTDPVPCLRAPTWTFVRHGRCRRYDACRANASHGGRRVGAESPGGWHGGPVCRSAGAVTGAHWTGSGGRRDRLPDQCPRAGWGPAGAAPTGSVLPRRLLAAPLAADGLHVKPEPGLSPGPCGQRCPRGIARGTALPGADQVCRICPSAGGLAGPGRRGLPLGHGFLSGRALGERAVASDLSVASLPWRRAGRSGARPIAGLDSGSGRLCHRSMGRARPDDHSAGADRRSRQSGSRRAAAPISRRRAWWRCLPSASKPRTC